MANQITPNPSVPTQIVADGLKFPKFINNLGIIPTSYKDSMSYYECLAWLCKYLEETVIPTVNQNGEAVEELQNLYIELNSYVDNYFNSLDVQEEINNKLDEMASSGVLQDSISKYFKDVNQQIENQNVRINTLINQQNTEIATLNTRVDNIIELTPGSTTGDAELQDIRVAYNGITYPSAGSSVRNQVSGLNQKIENLEIVNVANGTTHSRTEDITVISSDLLKYGQELKLKIKNFSSNNGYINYAIMYNSQAIRNGTAKAISANETVEYTIPLWYLTECDAIRIDNINSLNLYYEITIPFLTTFSDINKDAYKLTGNESAKYYGYITNAGKIMGATSGDNKFIMYTNVKKGDVFLYSGMYGWPVVWGYKSDGTAVSLLNGGTYENQTVEITTDDIIRVIGWSDESKKALKFCYFSFDDLYNKTKNILSIPNIIVVAKSGGDFDDIQSAINSAEATYDVSNTPVTIFIKNGVYELEPTSTQFPYACINKGANKVSLIGESKDGVILRVTNTSTAQNKILDVGGDCIIENLTLECLNDGTFTSETDLAHNCYCLHNDKGFTTDTAYNTIIRNCKFYSECNAPIGAGLQNNQTQIYENVETISNSALSQGSLYVHGPGNASTTNCSVIINNCNCQALDGKKALTLPDVPGSLQYTNIDTTIQRTICYSNGTNIIDDNFKTTHKLTNMSALNNISDLNK